MAIDPGQLLKRLEPPVRQVGSRIAAPNAPFESRGFDDLLQLVSSGKLRSDRPMNIEAATRGPLSGQQVERLAAAADRAEAAGARNAVMVMDGRAFTVDILNRAVTSELSALHTAPITGIDAAVYVARPDELTSDQTLRPGGGLSGVHPSNIALQDEEHAADSESDSRD